MEGKKGISVIACVYNEAHRIEHFLQSFAWCGDLIVVDKSSTDGTQEILHRYTDKVIIVPYSDAGDEAKLGVEIATNEWVMVLTASDIIHPGLVGKLLDLINGADFHYDVISVPFALYVFGIRSKNRSPWHSTRKHLLMKKSALRMTDVPHHERSLSSNNIFRMEYSEKENLYHLTYENVETLFERHHRYTQRETAMLDDEKSALKGSLKEVYKALKVVLFKKKCYLLGFDGVALGFAYIAYYIIKYLYVWDKFRGKGPTVYSELRAEMRALRSDYK
jgi:(heptosyl)LPS beta-1,4-glucosyltransferase